MKKREKDRMTRVISELLKLPEDVTCGDTRISIMGKTRVLIENYRSILLYSDILIKLRAKDQLVIVEGKQLRIRYYDQDEMEICGRIASVKFE